MKTYNKLILVILILASVVFNSCQEDYLDELPTEDVSIDSATATTNNLFLVINGIHRSLYIRYGSQGRSGIGALMLQNEALGDDYVMTANANNWFINTYKWLDHTNANDSDNLFPYRTYYRIIRNANIVINGADQAVGPIPDKNAAVGQALVYRAWAHFQIVQLYGKRYVPGTNNSQLGVPIRLTTESEPLARATVEEVYAQINKDLDAGIVALEEYSRPNKSHLDKSVAQGLKARVALVQGNYAVAAEFAEIARAGYTLMSANDYFNNFSDFTSEEWMWGSTIQEDQTDFFGNYGAFISRNYSSSNIRGNPKAINSTLYNTIPATDVRKSLFDPTGLHPTLPPGIEISSRHSLKPYTSQKFIAVSTGDSRMDVPYMRVSEMYLIEAEAKARLNDASAVNVLFDYAIVRDPSYTLSTNTGTALVDEVLLQRRWELWGEGFRFYDLKRMNLPLNRNGANHIASLAVIFDVPVGDNRWQFLIPQDALDANPLLVQNPL
ncbi:RagB/SusD family nutrient uptake outer membrane protein [Aquimarina sediminis]|uniref:RagB/SusD family nutrient uptake outer membrane protein n=1 Tax=Aquimarina sediminis TaxID=2070536 RepID=UPI000CA0074C|nr:RagB/SusD family nutrient uptake outer membrane protein [Aquimarina sediminis]